MPVMLKSSAFRQPRLNYPRMDRGRSQGIRGQQTKATKSSAEKSCQHRELDAYVKALEIDRTAKRRKLEEAFSEQLNEHQEATKKIFRIAYKQARNSRPFSDFSDEIDVQTANGMDLGRVLYTNVSCANIVDHIGNEMQKSMCKALIEDGAKFSVLIDGSITISKHSKLIIYLRFDFSHIQPVTVTVFLDLVEVTDETAVGMKEALLTCLNSHGLSIVGRSACHAAASAETRGGVCYCLEIGLPSRAMNTVLIVQAPVSQSW